MTSGPSKVSVGIAVAVGMEAGRLMDLTDFSVGFRLHLDGCMIDGEPITQELLYLIEHNIRLREPGGVEDDVAGKGMHIRGDTPDVEIVYLDDALQTLDRLFHLVTVDSVRSPFQQDIHRFFPNPVGTIEDDGSDSH